MNFKIVGLIVVACLAVVFVIQNVSAVTVSIFFWEISLSLALLIFLSWRSVLFSAGFCTVFWHIRRSKRK